MRQLWNSIRCLEFVLSLQGIDLSRLGVTGASGGATQTLLLTAVDDRIALSIPVVMVSTNCDSGCSCEIDMPIRTSLGCETSNVQIAALAAPRPMLLVSDGDDWTRNTPQVELPHIRRVHEFYGIGGNLEYAHSPEEKHDYGYSKREAANHIVADRFDMDLRTISNTAGTVIEEFVTALPRSELELFRAPTERSANRISGDADATRGLFGEETP